MKKILLISILLCCCASNSQLITENNNVLSLKTSFYRDLQTYEYFEFHANLSNRDSVVMVFTCEVYEPFLSQMNLNPLLLFNRKEYYGLKYSFKSTISDKIYERVYFKEPISLLKKIINNETFFICGKRYNFDFNNIEHIRKYYLRLTSDFTSAL